MNDFLESRLCRLTCVAPVHIGSGEMLKSFEYLYDKDRQKVYFLNEGKWAHFLASHNLLDEFTAVLDRTSNFSRINLWQWLQGKGFSTEDCDVFIKRKAISPRTIKLAVSGRQKQLMGLCSLEVIS